MRKFNKTEKGFELGTNDYESPEKSDELKNILMAIYTIDRVDISLASGS